jgi:hypothetical protein
LSIPLCASLDSLPLVGKLPRTIRGVHPSRLDVRTLPSGTVELLHLHHLLSSSRVTQRRDNRAPLTALLVATMPSVTVMHIDKAQDREMVRETELHTRIKDTWLTDQNRFHLHRASEEDLVKGVPWRGPTTTCNGSIDPRPTLGRIPGTPRVLRILHLRKLAQRRNLIVTSIHITQHETRNAAETLQNGLKLNFTLLLVA